MSLGEVRLAKFVGSEAFMPLILRTSHQNPQFTQIRASLMFEVTSLAEK
jgi:hypothetical protein